jgi:hypothetical protein
MPCDPTRICVLINYVNNLAQAAHQGFIACVMDEGITRRLTTAFYLCT